MGEVINLNKARKAKARDAKGQKAGENRALFGVAKADKLNARLARERAAKAIDQAKRDKPPE